MDVRDVMTKNPRTVAPNDSIQRAAAVMKEVDTGFVPIVENGRVVGVVTDRDIVIRAVAAGKGPDTPVREVMSSDVKYCYEDEDLDHVAQNMSDIQVRRLPVVDRNKRLVGIVSLGDLAVREKKAATQAVSGVSKPGGQHSQSARA